LGFSLAWWGRGKEKEGVSKEQEVRIKKGEFRRKLREVREGLGGNKP